MGNQQTESQQPTYRPNYLWAAILFGLLLVIMTNGSGSVLVIPAIILVVGSLVLTSLKPENKMMDSWFHVRGAVPIIHLAGGLPGVGETLP